MRFLLWFVAIGAALIGVGASLAVGRTPVTEGLFGLALTAGVLGGVADRVAR